MDLNELIPRTQVAARDNPLSQAAFPGIAPKVSRFLQNVADFELKVLGRSEGAPAARLNDEKLLALLTMVLGRAPADSPAIKGCDLKIPTALLTMETARPGLALVGFLPKPAIEAFLKAIVEGGQQDILNQGDLWRTLKTMRRLVKVAANTVRTFSTKHKGNGLGALNSSLGDVLDLHNLKHEGPELKAAAEKALKALSKLGPDMMPFKLEGASPAQVKSYLQDRLDGISALLSRPVHEYDEYHDVRQSVQMLMGVFRFVGLSQGARSAAEIPQFLAINGISVRMGQVVQQHLPENLDGRPFAHRMRSEERADLSYLVAQLAFVEAHTPA